MPMMPAELAALLRPFLLKDMAQVASGAAAQANWDARYLRRYRIRLYDPSGPTLAEYEPTSAGLDDAIAAALTAGGGTIQLPPGTYRGNHTIPAGVTLVGLARKECVLTGQVTLNDGSHLEWLTVDRDEDDAGAIYGVVAPASGTARIYGCRIDLTQSGTGDAYGIYSNAGGVIEVWACDISAESVNGDGYGTYRGASGGSIYVEGGVCTGNTDPCNE